jgi:hypothetical protein
MRLIGALAAVAAMVATAASAQDVDLTGQYRCVQGCDFGDQPAFVTQNGWNLNLTNEAGVPSRAWIDWRGHIWAERWQQGAIYSLDGMTIQFDRGTVWQRIVYEPAIEYPPPPTRPAKVRKGTPVTAVAPAARVPAPIRTVAPAAVAAFDGGWSVLILTQSGSCDRSYRYGVRIAQGNVIGDGGEAAAVQGRVAPNGAVRVSVSAGGQRADGEGRLSRAAGSGTWAGQGSFGACAGVWRAERRG